MIPLRSIHPITYPPGTRRDTNDFVGLRDIGVDLPVDVFEFIQILNWMACFIGDVDTLGHSKGFRI
jgi:hypothetical protein